MPFAMKSNGTGVHKPEDVKRVLLEKMVQVYERGGQNLVSLKKNPDGPTVILFVGVNGVGKTTSVGKIGYQLKQEAIRFSWRLPIPSGPVQSNS